MVGQKNLLRVIDKQISDNSFPRFSIIVGPRGSENYKIGGYVAKQLSANYVETPDVKVDTIRSIIQESYKVSTCTVYNITEADMMSSQAQNSLLKITEEPPYRAYFLLTLEDDNNTLPTIKSRGSIYHCDNYTSTELMDYASDKYGEFRYCEICDTPGEIDILHNLNADDFYSFVEKVVDNISEVSGSNVFKIADRIKLKDSDEGYDLILFWKAFQRVCFDREQYDRVKLTSKFLNLLRVRSINRQMLFDKWILEIRRLPDGDS